MSKLIRRSVFASLVFHANFYGEQIYYQPNEDVFSSSHEEYLFHSAEVKHCWIVAENLESSYDLTLRISEIQRTSTILIPKISLAPGTSLVYVNSLFPFFNSRQNLELGINHYLKVAIDPRLTGKERVTVNCFVEETGLAYESTTTQ